MVERKEPRPERAQTDESLRTERERSDEVAVAQEYAHHVEDEARSTETLARAAADAGVDAARDRADELPEALAQSRAREDEAVRVERASADEEVEQKHRASERAFAKLLILERERTDRDLLTERARSDEALANRDDFLGIVSHDLRNLICGVAMTAELVAAVSREETAVACAKQIQTYAARMNRLVRDLQDVASLDSGQLAIRPTLGDTTALVAEIVASFRLAASEKRIALESEVSEPAPAFFDSDRMSQVLSNLLTNAIKFTDEGGRVRIARAREAGMLRFSVQDTGVGIGPNDLEAVFERFWQVGKDDRRGFGLGLYIAKCIVEQHGGAIWAKSEPRKGTEVLFTLPASLGPPLIRSAPGGLKKRARGRLATRPCRSTKPKRARLARRTLPIVCKLSTRESISRIPTGGGRSSLAPRAHRGLSSVLSPCPRLGHRQGPLYRRGRVQPPVLAGQRSLPANKALTRLAIDGSVARVARGLWSLDGHLDPLLLPNHLTAPYPAYVSLWSALYLHGVIEQVPALTYAVTLGRSRTVRSSIGMFSLHHIVPELFDGWDTTPAGVALATVEKALFDVAYLSSTRNRSFSAFPELELPSRLRRHAIRGWLAVVSSARMRATIGRRLQPVLCRK